MVVHDTPPAGADVPKTRVPKMFDSLRDPNFRSFLLASTFASIPMASNQVTQGYLAYQLSGAATGLGIVTLAWGVPQILLTMFAGVLADRFERRRILSITQTSSGVLTLFTAILIHLGLIQLWHLVAIALVQGCLFAFNMPARQGMVSDVVSKERMLNAVALNNTMFQVTRIGAPALIGALIAIPAFGVSGAYDMLAISYFLAAFFLYRLKSRQVISTDKKGSVLGELGEALRYMRSHPVLPTILLMALVPILVAMPFQMLTPAFAETMFHAGPTGLGLLLMMIGIGSLFGSLTTAALVDSPNKMRFQLFAVLALGVTMMAFSRVTDLLPALVLMALVGISTNIYMGLNQAQLMQYTDHTYLGRVIGIYMLSWSFTPLTTMPVSASIDIFGPPNTILALGSLIIVLALVFYAVGQRRMAGQYRAANESRDPVVSAATNT